MSTTTHTDAQAPVHSTSPALCNFSRLMRLLWAKGRRPSLLTLEANWAARTGLRRQEFRAWNRIHGISHICAKGDEGAVTFMATTIDQTSQISGDLYSWLDSIVHEALPHNYEDLNPRELRELLTSALYERLTDDKDFQSAYIDLIFQPKEITIEVEGGMQGCDLVFRPADVPGLYNGYRRDGSLYASDLTQTQVKNIVIFGEPK